MNYQNDLIVRGRKRFSLLGRVILVSVTLLTLLFLAFLGARSTIFASKLATPRVAAPANSAVTTYHNDNLRTGQDTNESILTPGNVNSNQFGKRVTYPVDGQVYAQPLFLPNVTINGAAHNVVYVATENDSVYAFDADQTAAVAPLWKASFTGPNVTAVPAADVFTRYPNHDIDPLIGITSTPVIDPATNILYVVAMTKENGQFFQRIHAIDVTTGAEKAGSPVAIQASVAGTGDESSGGQVRFNAQRENQRPALLLANGVVYISWSSFGDTDPYHGWLIGYHYTGSTLQQTAVYNDSANGSEGGIWMSGDGPAADSSGNVYLITGNGSYNLNTGGPNSGDSFLKLNPNGLGVTDYFTPFNQSCLSSADADLGSGGELLLPDQTNTAHPHLVIGAGKEGRIYVVDRDNMGHFTTDPNLNCNGSETNQTTSDKVLQELPPGTIGSDFSTPAYWASSSNAWVYISGIDGTLKAFQVSNDTLSATPTSKTPENFQFPGVTPSISSNGNANGIVWVVGPPPACSGNGCNPSGPGVLRAYDATNLGTELYNSSQNAARDQLATYTKFSVPTIANGEVFVGTQSSLSIYGSPTTSGGTGITSGAAYTLTNGASGRVLDEPGNLTGSGTPVEIWDNNGGSNQHWTLTQNGDGSYTLTNGASGRVLDEPGNLTGDGTPVEIWDNNGGSNQHWTPTKNSDGSYTFTNGASGRVLDEPGNLTGSGTPVEIWDNNGGSNQHWTLTQV